MVVDGQVLLSSALFYGRTLSEALQAIQNERQSFHYKSMIITDEAWNSFLQIVAEAGDRYDRGYAQAEAEGYDKGYKDGYADGVDDK